VYLFGSCAGRLAPRQRLDIIVVSRAFEGMGIGRRYALVRALLPPDVSVELLLHTPEEFERARSRSVILRDAERYWVRIC